MALHGFDELSGPHVSLLTNAQIRDYQISNQLKQRPVAAAVCSLGPSDFGLTVTPRYKQRQLPKIRGVTVNSKFGGLKGPPAAAVDRCLICGVAVNPKFDGLREPTAAAVGRCLSFGVTVNPKFDGLKEPTAAAVGRCLNFGVTVKPKFQITY